MANQETSKIGYEAQLACARRELALRQRCYPRWIESRRMTQEKADIEIECMAAIVKTLEKLKHLKEVGDEMLSRKREP